METGKGISDFLFSEEFDNTGKEFGANFAEKWTRIAEVLKIAGTDDDVRFGFDGGIIKFGGFTNKMLAVGVHQNSVIIIMISGIFEASLDSPSITHIKEVSDAADTGLLDYCGGVVGGIIVNNYDVGVEMAFFDGV